MALGYEKNYSSFPSVNHTPPPGHVEQKERREREGGKTTGRCWEGQRGKGRVLIQSISSLIIPSKRFPVSQDGCRDVAPPEEAPGLAAEGIHVGESLDSILGVVP